jgi:hypothetical protein
MPDSCHPRATRGRLRSIRERRGGPHQLVHGGGDGDQTRPAQHADDQVAQGRRSGAGAELGGVLGEGGVAEVVQRLDRPVPAQRVGEPGGAGQSGGPAS